MAAAQLHPVRPPIVSENVSSYEWPPLITDFENIITATKDYVDEYIFDKLDLRSSFKTKMFNFIKHERKDLIPLYDAIYIKKASDYFEKTADVITNYCNKNNIKYNINYRS